MTMSIRNSLTVFALCTMFLIGCKEKPDSPSNLDASGLDPASRPPVRAGVLGPLPVVKMEIKNELFTLEVADEDQEKQQGLMYRKSMPKRHGMIFVWPNAEPRGFWMKDTEVALDLIFLDQTGKVIAIHAGRPLDRSRIICETPSQYVIELIHGTANEVGLRLGDVIELPDSLR